MTTYTPGQRVHVRTPLISSPGFDQDGTYVERDGQNSHKVLLDGRQSYLHFWDHEVTPVSHPETLIENADWPDAVAEMGKELETGANRKRRYTITFEENEA